MKITSPQLQDIIMESVKTILETQYYKDGNRGDTQSKEAYEAWLDRKNAHRKAYYDNLRKNKPVQNTSGAIDYKSYKHGEHPVMKENAAVNEPDPHYTHYAVNKETGKIVNGWDYTDVDGSELRQFKHDYFIVDLIDMELDPKMYKVVGKAFLVRSGVDPQDWSNWSQN